MSFYNMLFGVNSAAPVLLATLGLTLNDVPRFRDCYIDGEHIVIHTRTGGHRARRHPARPSARLEQDDGRQLRPAYANRRGGASANSQGPMNNEPSRTLAAGGFGNYIERI